MADGFRIDINGERAAQLKAAAYARGVEPSDYAGQLLDQTLEDEADRAEIERRVADFQVTGDAVDHAKVIAMLKRRARGEDPA